MKQDEITSPVVGELQAPLSKKEKQKIRMDRYMANPANREKQKARSAAYAEANKEKLKAYNIQYYQENKEEMDAASKAWALANPEQKKAVDAAYREANKEKLKEQSATYYQNNKEKLTATNKAWSDANPEQVKANKAAWWKRKSQLQRGMSSEDAAKDDVPLTQEEKTEKRRDYAANWRKENQASIKAYRDNPGAKESAKKAAALRNSTPEKIEAMKLHNATPKAKAQRKAYASSPRGTAVAKEHCARRRALIKGVTVGDSKEITSWINGCNNLKRVVCYWCNSKIKPKSAHIDHIIPLSKGGSHSVDNLCCSCSKCNLSKSSKLPSDWNYQLTQPVLLL